MARYFDKVGKPLAKKTWQKLQRQASYKFIRRYENEKFHAEVVWSGEVTNVSEMPREYWPLFEFNAYNVMRKEGSDEKKLVKDPEYSGTYANEAEAIMEYEAYLARYTECGVERSLNAETMEEEEQWVEHGNLLEPIEDEQPEDDKVSEKVFETNEIAGSW